MKKKQFFLHNIFNFKSLLVFLLLVLVFGITTQTTAQCTGPYARFESIGASGTFAGVGSTAANGFTSSPTAVSFGTSTTNARSGKFFVLTTANGVYLTTPAITSPRTFSFYIRTSASPNGPVNFVVEYSTDNFTTPININTVGGVILPAVATTSYQQVSVTLPYINSSNVKFRITDNNVRSGTPSPPFSYSGQLFIDDISWDTYTSSGSVSTGYPENTILAPVQQGNGVPIVCSPVASAQTWSVASDASYNFYDNGARMYDMGTINVADVKMILNLGFDEILLLDFLKEIISVKIPIPSDAKNFAYIIELNVKRELFFQHNMHTFCLFDITNCANLYDKLVDNKIITHNYSVKQKIIRITVNNIVHGLFVIDSLLSDITMTDIEDELIQSMKPTLNNEIYRNRDVLSHSFELQ